MIQIDFIRNKKVTSLKNINKNNVLEHSSILKEFDKIEVDSVVFKYKKGLTAESKLDFFDPRSHIIYIEKITVIFKDAITKRVVKKINKQNKQIKAKKRDVQKHK